MIVVLGVHGFAGSGKDAFADTLVHWYGFKKIAFADPLRDVLLDTNPVLMVDDGRPVHLREVIDTIGWGEAKILYPEIRRMMVALGQSMRQRVDSRIWINAAIDRMGEAQRVVFSDVRQLNEAMVLKATLGAQLVNLLRPGVGPANSQEQATLPPQLLDFVVRNDGDLTDLHARADMVMHRINVQRTAPQ
ncbi:MULTISPECIES: hypothetical protein [Streptosporangium]|uniref:ATP-binding protein n=1 Tax=Streptosporangium brasiliense TaxID=47480 RepID=A0ABT9RM93_9ACTN|nr:hypothetical protein [Streptosporangium brasiliense]MDP9870418.1 hypothetical protein [Streptosporangium brasiliense]